MIQTTRTLRCDQPKCSAVIVTQKTSYWLQHEAREIGWSIGTSSRNHKHYCPNHNTKQKRESA